MRSISSLVTWLALAWLSLVWPVVSAENPTDRKVVQITRLSGLVIGPDAFDVRVVGKFAYLAAGFNGLKVIDVSDPAKPSVVGGFDTGGRTRAVEVVGNLVYLADYEGGLVVVDVSNPAQPVRIGGFDTSGSARSVRVAGNYAFVADYDAGLQVFNVSNPATPVLVGSLDTVGNSRGVRIDGNFAFLANETNGLQIINVEDPTNPVSIGEIDTGGLSFDTRIVDNFAYVADWDAGLQIVDLRNLSAPTLVGSYNTQGAALSVQVSGKYAYIADADRGLLAIDVSSPSRPQLAGAFDTSGIAYGIHVVGNLAYLAESSENGAGGLQIFRLREGIEQHLALELPATMTYTNAPLPLPGITSMGLPVSYRVVSGPATVNDSSLTLIGEGEVSLRAEQAGNELVLPLIIEQTIRVLPNQTLTWLTPSDDILALNTPHFLSATVNSGLPVTFRVITGPGIIQAGALVITNGGSVTVEATQDGSDIFAQTSLLRQFNRGITIPTLVGTFNTKGTAVGVDVVENLAYVADSAAGLQIIDVTSATNPTLVGSYDTSGSAYRVQVVGRYAYIADGASGMQIVDVSNPIQPVRVGGFDTPGSARFLQVAGNYAYVADGDAGLQVLNISNPTAPILVGNLDTDGFTAGVHVTGDFGYLADQRALRLIDLSNPERPLLVQSVPRRADSVVSSGRYAFTANSALSFEVLDFGSSTASPTVGSSSLSGISKDVAIDDDSAYVATYIAGLHVIDIRDPLHPLPGARIDTPGQALGVRVVGNRAYVADGNAGLQIFSLRKGIDQILTLPLTAEVTFTNAPFSLPDVSSRGLPVTYRVVSGPAQVEGNALRLTGTGTLVVRAEQPGTELFLPAEAERTIQVVPNQSLTWLTPTTSVLTLDTPHLLRVDASSGLPTQFRVVRGPAKIQNGALVITNVDTVVIAAEQRGSDIFSPVVEQKTINLVTWAPHLVGSAMTKSQPWAVRVAGQYAYVAEASFLNIVDLADKPSPKIVDGIRVGGGYLELAGRFIYLAGGIIHVIGVADVNNPVHPWVAGAYAYFPDGISTTEAVQVVDDYAYVADGLRGLSILRVSDPRQPELIGNVDTPGRASDVRVVGNYAYVADGTAGLQVIDVGNSLQPKLVGTLPDASPAVRLCIENGYAYVACLHNGLRIVDIRNPNNPQLVSSFHTSSYAKAVRVVGAYAYVANDGGGLEFKGIQVVDVSDPITPFRVSRFDTGDTVDLDIVSDYVYGVSKGTDAVPGDGLRIVRFRKGVGQEVTLNLPTEVSFSVEPITLSGTASSDLPVSFKVVSGPATVSANHLHLTGAGVVDVVAEQGGNDFFAPVQVTRQLKVLPAAQTLTISAIPQIVSPFRTVGLTALSSAGLPVTFSVVSGPATVAGKRLSLTGEGSVTVRASQSGDSRYAPAEVDRTFVFQFQPLAKVSLDPLSIVLHPAETTGGNAILFTTFDGTSGLPLFDSVFGQTLVSGEVKLLSNPTNTWATDYITGLEYGSLTFSDPTADSDTNGLPDLAEQAKAIDRSFVATLRQDSPNAGRTIPVQLRLIRNGATSEGDYSATATTPLGPITYEGKWWAGHFETIAEFDRMRRELKLNLSLEDPSGRTRILKATVPYSRGTDGSLMLPAFAAEQTVDGLASGAVQFPTVRLPWQSDARAFRGPLKLLDGNTETSWPDMTDYIMTVFDPGDRDGDSIANMVDEWIQPSMQILSDSAGTIIHLEIRAEFGEQLIVETSTDLSQWTEAGQLTGQGSTFPAHFDLSLIDSEVPRFWRIRGQ